MNDRPSGQARVDLGDDAVDARIAHLRDRRPEGNADHDRSQLDDDPTAHAVILTIRAAARKLGTRRLSDVTIFTTNEPCPMCVGALLETQVRALVFAVPDEERGSAGTVLQLARNKALPHQISIISGVREAEARRLAEGTPAST